MAETGILSVNRTPSRWHGHKTRAATLHGHSPGRHPVPPLEGSLCRCYVQRRSACGNHSGLIVKTIPRYCENCSPSRRNHCSSSAWNLVRLHSGTLFTFAPESCPPSPGIRKNPRTGGVCHRFPKPRSNPKHRSAAKDTTTLVNSVARDHIRKPLV